jgi:hypothetical protein
MVDCMEMEDIGSLAEVLDHTKPDLLQAVQHLLYTLSLRIQDLRNVKVGKTLALDKLMNQVSVYWKTSKLAFAISALKTRLYEIDSRIISLLYTLNAIGQAASMCTDTACLRDVHIHIQSAINGLIYLNYNDTVCCIQSRQVISMTGRLLSSLDMRNCGTFHMSSAQGRIHLAS